MWLPPKSGHMVIPCNTYEAIILLMLQNKHIKHTLIAQSMTFYIILLMSYEYFSVWSPASDFDPADPSHSPASPDRTTCSLDWQLLLDLWGARFAAINSGSDRAEHGKSPLYVFRTRQALLAIPQTMKQWPIYTHLQVGWGKPCYTCFSLYVCMYQRGWRSRWVGSLVPHPRTPCRTRMWRFGEFASWNLSATLTWDTANGIIPKFSLWVLQ